MTVENSTILALRGLQEMHEEFGPSRLLVSGVASGAIKEIENLLFENQTIKAWHEKSIASAVSDRDREIERLRYELKVINGRILSLALG